MTPDHLLPAPFEPPLPRPEVCVVVRTMDRPSLPRAVQSALDQGQVRVHVLVVAAHGGHLTQLGGLREDPRVQVLEPQRPLGRSAAANAGLEHTRAPLALFLDDDDWLLPTHLQGLLAALAARPEAVAAYTGVRCVSGDPEAPHTVHVFEREATWSGMQLQNQLPIHAVLFRIAAVRDGDGQGFDEDLDHFEDWDFWLRLMARGPFVQVPGVTAVYWLDDQTGSGHAAEGPRRHAMLAHFARRLLKRWTPDDVVGLIDQHVIQVQQMVDLGQQVTAVRSELSTVAAELHNVVQLAHAAQAEAASLHDRLGQAELGREQALAEREQARELAAALSQERVALRADLDAHRREVAVLAAVREDHLRQIDRLNGQIAALLASTSWRMTRPLRALGSAWAGWRGGRWQTTARNGAFLALSSWRRHGALGVLRRLPHYLRSVPRYVRELSHPRAAPGTNPFAAVAPTGAVVRLHPEIAGASESIDATVSVVIPALNGGDELQSLIRKLLGQQALRGVEVVVVDSGSNDGTPERSGASGARVVCIPPADFSHSHARNLGAEHATGDYLLFMVQDAFPIGDLWLYGMLRWLLDHREQGVVAASCAEYCRSDSDAMYDCMVNTHYQFLGCLDHDRIGHHVGDDHMSLRSMGQLSDVACLIPRDLFMVHRYRGDYAEDLDLGIRLIRAGHRIAMLASVKVIHSHNRPAWYYLKRSFVDVIFLVGLFDDFACPPCRSVAGLMLGMQRVVAQVSAWLPQLAALPNGRSASEAMARWTESSRHWAGTVTGPSAVATLGDAQVEAFLAQLWTEALELPRLGGSMADVQQEAQAFVDGFVARADHFNRYAAQVYGGADERLRLEVADAVRKTLAATVGAALAYFYLDRRSAPEADAERQWAARLFQQLKAGV